MLTKVPNVEKSIIHFLAMVEIGHTEDDLILLCFKENDIHQWMIFTTILPQNIPTLFETYTNDGTSTGNQFDISKGMHMKFVPALAYCNLMVGKQHPNYDDPTKWVQKEFEDFFHAFCLNKVDNAHVQNIIGKLSSNQVSRTSVTSLLNAQLLANFHRASLSFDKIIVFNKDCQWTIFKKNIILHYKTTNCYCILDPTFKTTTIQPNDDQALYSAQSDWVSLVFLNVLKTNKAILIHDDPKNENCIDLAWTDIVVLY